MITHPDPRLLSSPKRRPSISDLRCDHRILTECQGEAIIEGDSAQVDKLNARLDAIEADLARRPAEEWSAYDAQRYLREREKGR